MNINIMIHVNRYVSAAGEVSSHDYDITLAATNSTTSNAAPLQ